MGRGTKGEAAPAIGVRLLGGFELTADGRAIAVPAGTQRIIAILALRGRCARARLAGMLWPDSPELRGLASLRTALWRANQAVPGLVECGHDSVALAAGVCVDVTSLVGAARALLDHGRGAPTGGPGLVDPECADGDLLPDWSDEWLVVDRERLRQLRLHVLETLADRLAQDGRFGLALEAALACMRSDPLRESAHRAVIRVHLAEGNLAEALHAFGECQTLLDRELGVPPSRQTAQLVRDLLRGRRAERVPGHWPPPKAPARGVLSAG